MLTALGVGLVCPAERARGKTSHAPWKRGEIASILSGIGARVKVTRGDLVQIDKVHSGRGYQSHHGLRLYFGLGSHRKADLIEVHWIGGKKDVLRNVAADQLITITETTAKPE